MARLFEQREKAFEAQWAHDEEMRFRAVARRNELLARWAASQMGLEGQESIRYVEGVVEAGLARKDGTLFSRIREDLASHQANPPDLAILRKMDECLRAACVELGLA